MWEARDQEPAFGPTYVNSPKNNGEQWVEVEAEWPDGRRSVGTATFMANSPVVTWVSNALPAGANPGADGGDGWTWATDISAPVSGAIAHVSNLAAGLHEHYFTGATGTMDVSAGDTLFAWVYLDPANPPTEIMLMWNDGSSWEHRAYWGANSITYGNNGTAGRFQAGALPPTGQWVKLSVPASAVGLEGTIVSGMVAFTQFDGRATWARPVGRRCWRPSTLALCHGRSQRRRRSLKRRAFASRDASEGRREELPWAFPSRRRALPRPPLPRGICARSPPPRGRSRSASARRCRGC